MAGYYKVISKDGKENVVDMTNITSDKDVYTRYYDKTRKEKKKINVREIDSSPVYSEELITKFYFIKDKIEENIKFNLNIKEVKTPEILQNNKRLEELQKLFGLETFYCNDKYILAPASDFGIFSSIQDKNFIDNELPINIYEFTKCYRVEDKKKDPLKRPTSFFLPDMHCILEKNIYKEVLKHLRIYEKILNELEIPYFIALRISEKEYENNKKDIFKIAKNTNKDIIVNIVPTSIRYWESKFKYIYKDSENQYIQLSTVQVDYKTAQIFNIKVKGENAKILHSSVGSMERMLYAFLDKE